MIKIEENQKSEAQIRLEEKLERDRAKLQEQIRKDQKKIEELKRKAKSIIGEMFAEYLPDYYCFEGSELKEIIDAAMNQEIVLNKISEIRNRDSTDEAEQNGKAEENEAKPNDTHMIASELSDPEKDETDEADEYEENSSDDDADGDDENDPDEETDEDDENDSYDEES